VHGFSEDFAKLANMLLLRSIKKNVCREFSFFFPFWHGVGPDLETRHPRIGPVFDYRSGTLV
jgi:hypothetical protein